MFVGALRHNLGPSGPQHNRLGIFVLNNSANQLDSQRTSLASAGEIVASIDVLFRSVLSRVKESLGGDTSTDAVSDEVVRAFYVLDVVIVAVKKFSPSS